MHQYRNLCQHKNKLDEMRIIEANNLGAFYRHVNKRIKHRDPVPALMDSSGGTVTSDKKKLIFSMNILHLFIIIIIINGFHRDASLKQNFSAAVCHVLH